MLFIDTKTSEVSIKIPKNNSEFVSSYTMDLKSQATNQTYSFSGLTDASGLTDYYSFNINFSQVKSGEYEYTVGGDKGLIQIGKRTTTYTSYNKDNVDIEYKA